MQVAINLRDEESKLSTRVDTLRRDPHECALLIFDGLELHRPYVIMAFAAARP